MILSISILLIFFLLGWAAWWQNQNVIKKHQTLDDFQSRVDNCNSEIEADVLYDELSDYYKSQFFGTDPTARIISMLAKIAGMLKVWRMGK